MTKLQPNFAWQKYEGKKDDEKEQFQYQLQVEHAIVANSVNASIDDLSYITFNQSGVEKAVSRATSWAWVNTAQIYKIVLPTVPWTSVGTLMTIPIPVTGNFQVIFMQCCLSDGKLSSSNTVNLPHLDVITPANSIGWVRNGTSIFIGSGGTDYSAFSGYVTLYYIQT